MEEYIVKVNNLSHRYAKNWAIQDINFEIKRQGVVGLLGSNGAGKSTTMNIICGSINQTKGDVWLDGFNMRKQPEEAKKRIGFLPQVPPLYPELTINEYLRHCAHLHRIPREKIKWAIDSAKERCGISHFGNRLIGNLSGGYRQRVGLAQAILHKPKLVILDEPTTGLDPNQIVEVRKLIKEISKERAVLLSSHIMADVAATCQHIMMIEHGKIIFSNSIEKFNNSIESNALIVSMENPPQEEEIWGVAGVMDVQKLNAKQFRVTFERSENVSEKIIEISATKGWRLRELLLEKSTMEDVFAKLSKDTAVTTNQQPK